MRQRNSFKAHACCITYVFDSLVQILNSSKVPSTAELESEERDKIVFRYLTKKEQELKSKLEETDLFLSSPEELDS